MKQAKPILIVRTVRTFACALLLPFVFQPAMILAADAGHEPVHAEAVVADEHGDPVLHEGAAAGEHADAAAGAHGEEHGSDGLPQLNPVSFPTQLFWLFVTFSIMYLVFSRKALPEISGVIEGRRQHIDSDLNAAQNLKEEAESIQQAYEEGLESARNQSTQAFMDVEQTMKDKTAAQAKAFQERSASQLDKAEKSIVNAKAAAMEEMSTLAAEIARKAAEKIIGVETDIKQAKDVVNSIHSNRAKAA